VVVAGVASRVGSPVGRAPGASSATLARVWYMTSTASRSALANTSRPSSPGTAFAWRKPRRSVQKATHGSTASTMSTGESLPK